MLDLTDVTFADTYCQDGNPRLHAYQLFKEGTAEVDARRYLSMTEKELEGCLAKLRGEMHKLCGKYRVQTKTSLSPVEVEMIPVNLSIVQISFHCYRRGLITSQGLELMREHFKVSGK